MHKILKSSLSRFNRANEDSEKMEKMINDLLTIHGLDDDSLDSTKLFNKIIKSRLSDVSIDDNSNKSGSIASVEGSLQDAISPIKKKIGYEKLYEQMCDDYGVERASILYGKMLDLSIGLSDSTNILKPYCWALSASFLIDEGRQLGHLKASKCKHIMSYISNLSELVHQLSNHVAGALGIGTFFVDIARLAITSDDIIISDLSDKESSSYKYMTNCFQQFIYSINHLSRSNVESPFTNISIFDINKLRAIVDDIWHTIQEPEFSKEHLIDVTMQMQEVFMQFFDKGDPNEGGRPYRFPVVTINISKDSSNAIVDNGFVHRICNNHDVPRYNIFISEGTKIASCCRMINNSDMISMGAQSNSFGGSSISLGSHRVATINLNRAVLESSSFEKAIELINQITREVILILQSHRKLLMKYKHDYSLHPFIGNIISMNRMFSTVGILGLYEASVTAFNKFDSCNITNEKIMMCILKEVQKVVEESNKNNNFATNIEQIPAESFAVRLSKADKIIFGDENVPFELYSNQYIPLWKPASVWERLSIDGLYNHVMTGGGIVHAPVDGEVSPDLYIKIINHAVKSGCEHFAISHVYSECANGHITKSNNGRCPICNGEILEKYTRVIGYFTPVSSWSKTRREWEFPRRKHVSINEKLVHNTNN